MTFVNNILKNLGTDSNGCAIAWCGGASNLNAESVWRWTQSGKKVGDFVWGQGEPGNGHLENFLGFESFHNYSGAAIDSARSCYPLCQQKM